MSKQNRSIQSKCPKWDSRQCGLRSGRLRKNNQNLRPSETKEKRTLNMGLTAAGERGGGGGGVVAAAAAAAVGDPMPAASDDDADGGAWGSAAAVGEGGVAASGGVASAGGGASLLRLVRRLRLRGSALEPASSASINSELSCSAAVDAPKKNNNQIKSNRIQTILTDGPSVKGVA